MSCDVCLYAPDDIENEFFSAQAVTARKSHTCGECKGQIVLGSQYERSTEKADGTFFTFASCRICAEIRSVFHCGGGYYLGTLWDDMENEAFGDLTTASECFRELSVEAKRVVMDKWQIWKGLSDAASS